MPVGPSAPPPAAAGDASPALRPVTARTDAAGVTAVLVAHDGARWLPAALEALEAQTARPGVVVAVDTGSTDGSGDLLRAALGADAVLTLPTSTGYGEAVAAALAARPASTWLWLLHDDAAPDPGCLAALLAEAGRQPSAAVLGPKAVDWDDPGVLVEVGVTTDRSGARITGLERREPDQGQHDAVRDVLAVGTAGALVDRELWDAVGGLDPALPLFRDELDLGWRTRSAGRRVVVVPRARLRHVRAATTGRRAAGALRGSAVRADRRHAMFVLLAHASRRRLLVALPAVVLGSLLRAVGLLVLRRAGAAADELAALGGLLTHPGTLHRARARRRSERTVPPGVAGALLASRTVRLRARVEAAGGWLSSASSARRARSVGQDPDDDLAPLADGALRAVLGRPGVLLVLALALVALVAERALLVVHGGVLSGGRLLPAPGGAHDLWTAWTASWSSTGVGTGASPPPLLAVVAALSTLLLGKAELAVDVLLLAAVPLSGATAWLAARRAVESPVLRLWAAATWALLPVATGAVAAGRLDAAGLQVVLPLVAVAVARLRRDVSGAWHRAWGAGLLLTLACALSPALLLVAVPLLVATAVAALVLAPSPQRTAAARRAVALVLVAVLPLLLLLPWTASALRHPALLAAGPGRLVADPALSDPALPAWHLPLLSPGGAGVPPVWVTVGLLLAGLGGLLRLARRRVATAAWAATLGALLVALVLARSTVSTGGPAAALWPGPALQVAGLGVLLAAVVAGDGVRERLSRVDFGWRQATASAVAVLAAATPVLAAAAWVVRGADDPVRRDAPQVLPAFVAADLAGAQGVRALVLHVRPGGGVGYDLTTGAGVHLGAGDLPLEPSQERRLNAVVADLVTAGGGPAAEALATRAVRYVALPAGSASTRAGAAVVSALDGQTGLVRRSSEQVLLWQVQVPTARLVVLHAPLTASARRDAAPAPDQLAAAPPEPVPATAGDIRTRLPAGSGDRLLVLAEAHDRGWTATVDGRSLPAGTAWGWAQAFVLPPGTGTLVVRHSPGRRSAELAVEAVALVLVAALAVPGARPRHGLESAPATQVEP